MISRVVLPAMRSGLAEGSVNWHVIGCLSSVAYTPSRAAARPFAMAVHLPILRTVKGKGQPGVRAGACDFWECVVSSVLGAGLEGLTIGIDGLPQLYGTKCLLGRSLSQSARQSVQQGRQKCQQAAMQFFRPSVIVAV